MYLRRHNHRRLDCEFRMIIPYHDCWRRNLLHGRLRNVSLRRLELVAVATTTAAARLRLSWLHHRNVKIRSDEGHGFLGLLDDLATEQDRASDHQCEEGNVRNQRDSRTLSFVVIKAPDVFYGNWLRGQDQWRKLLGEEGFLEVSAKRGPGSLLRAFRHEQIQLWFRFGGVRRLKFQCGHMLPEILLVSQRYFHT